MPVNQDLGRTAKEGSVPEKTDPSKNPRVLENFPLVPAIRFQGRNRI